MTGLMLSGLVMGAIGSLHCIGMCGPLALSVPVPGTSLFAKFCATFLYNAGRVMTYTLLGAAFGTMGASFSLLGIQQWLSITAGLIILLYLLKPNLLIYRNGDAHFQSALGKLRSALAKFFTQKNYRAVFFTGILNGLLPCGLVYMAITASLTAGSVTKSSLFMAAFGTGTLPLMWGMIFFGNMVSLKHRVIIRRAYPYLMFTMACFLILRGLGLGIPLISPQWQQNTEIVNSMDCYPAP